MDEEIHFFPLSSEEEERQISIAIYQSLQETSRADEREGVLEEGTDERISEEEESEIGENENRNEATPEIIPPPASSREQHSSSNPIPVPYTKSKTEEISSQGYPESTDSPQMLLRRSMSIGNGSPPRPTFLTDCCEVKDALMFRNREYIKCLVASWGRVTSPIHAAVKKGHHFCLEALLNSFPDLANSVNTKGETPLYVAAFNSKSRALKQLLQNGADPNQEKNSLETPLMAAVDNDSREMVAALLQAGAEVNKPLNRGWTALHEAVYRGHFQVLQVLLNHGGNPNIRDTFGISPVFTSAACGRNECLQMLLRAGGDPNLCAKSRSASPLYEACKENHSQCVATLLQFGANPHLVNCEGLYPIHIASYRGSAEIVEQLLEVTNLDEAQDCGMSPVHSAAKGDNVDILEMLIDRGYDVNVKLEKDKITYRDRRQTALFFAVYNDSEDATELLLRAGADTELDYIKPLLVAISHSQYAMAELLVSYGADINACFSENETNYPATIAFGLRDFRMLKQILLAGCDVGRCLSCEIGDRNHEEFDESLRKRNFCHILTETNHIAWCGSTILLLLQFTKNIRLCSKVLEAVQGSDEWEDIKSLISKPNSLEHFCRLKIRSCLKHGGTDQLSLPDPVKQYLKHNV